VLLSGITLPHLSISDANISTTGGVGACETCLYLSTKLPAVLQTSNDGAAGTFPTNDTVCFQAGRSMPQQAQPKNRATTTRRDAQQVTGPNDVGMVDRHAPCGKHNAGSRTIPTTCAQRHDCMAAW